MKSLLIHAWMVHKSADGYYLPYTHWIYLNEIVNYYDEICLLSPVNADSDLHGLQAINQFKNVKVLELPPANSYVSSIKYFRQYVKAYKKCTAYENVYVRYPVPFGWLSKVYLKKANRIIHFVGDPIDAAKNNPNFSVLKKTILTNMFMPEHLMYMWACKGAKVFTNGYHLKERLKKYDIDATPLISSTLNNDDYYFDANKSIDEDNLKLLYIGYLRKAKGIETIIRSLEKVIAQYPNASLSIVGTGESEDDLKAMSEDLNMADKIKFWGHIENRDELNNMMRSHDVFCFASLSEGSPRVILEAMANGLNVVSTPVGSLPFIFVPGMDILFADFNNEDEFFTQINYLASKKYTASTIRLNAYNKVKEFTIQSFIRKIFA